MAATESRARALAPTASDRRAELLSIAAELFATQGFAQTTVRDIAEQAGILSGSLYHHFASKEAMLDEILRDFIVGLHERFALIEREGTDPTAALDALISHSFSSIHTTPYVVALYQNESDALTRLKDFAYVGETSRKNEAIWIRVIKAGQKSGAFRADVDPALTYRFIRDAVWSAVHWYRPGGRLKWESLAAQYLTVLHGGLLASGSD